MYPNLLWADSSRSQSIIQYWQPFKAPFVFRTGLMSMSLPCAGNSTTFGMWVNDVSWGFYSWMCIIIMSGARRHCLPLLPLEPHVEPLWKTHEEGDTEEKLEAKVACNQNKASGSFRSEKLRLNFELVRLRIQKRIAVCQTKVPCVRRIVAYLIPVQ